MRRIPFLAACSLLGCGLFAQNQNHFSGAPITGQIRLTATVNVSQVSAAVHSTAHLFRNESFRADDGTGNGESASLETSFNLNPKLTAPQAFSRFALDAISAAPPMQSLAINPVPGGFGFDGLSHFDQRQANGGNQLSTEPASPSVAVGNGFLLEGVNDAIEVYDLSGKPLLPMVLSANQLFALAPALNRTTNVFGPFLTDMRVFYDQTINRWFVLQRGLDNNSAGATLNSSHIYMAVSQTGDPTGTYNIYTMDTTDLQNSRCPCLADYPQIGADQYGFYIAANEYDTAFNNFVDATIIAISKASLAAGSSTPTAFQFMVPRNSGYEFAIQPATTPPGASYFLANGGIEYMVSSQATFLPDSNLAIWAVGNTASLGTGNPNLSLTQTLVPAIPYASPDIARQKAGPYPDGMSLFQPLPVLDGGDMRVQSLTYSGGRLYVTLPTSVTDENGKLLVGGAYVILSPTFRSGIVAASVLRQGYLLVKNNSLLRPAIAVNAQGAGAVTFTLVGADYYPSAAFVPISASSTGSTVQIAVRRHGPRRRVLGLPG